MADKPKRDRPHTKWNLVSALLITALPLLYVLSYSPVMVLAGPDGIISAEAFNYWYSPVYWLYANVPPFGFAIELHNSIWWELVGRD